ncbi:MAG: histidinol-phosphatase HisJ family protein [Verrucomicrobiota bacterium]|nr:histidinol-phosphatase HisJ family protein [Chthoniobacterales bacterium]MDQ3413571.1 histidinol-phosphatase HisJ family protein [Verrucomicrobiota bacterium]
MTLFSDYHLHPQGHRPQPYTQALLQPWAEHAREIGLTDIALTDHDRYHAGVDFDEIDRLREANPDLKIRAGIELDNDPVHSAAGRAWVEKNWDRLDFVLGSVHFLRGDWAFDHAGQEAEFERRDIDEVYADYYERIRAMAASGLVDCMAHLDLVKIFGFRPTKDLGDLLEAVLSEIKHAGLAMELSTAGWRKPVGELYPSDDFIHRALAKGIRFTTASDGHSHVQQGENFERLAEKMTDLSIAEVLIFERHQPVAVSLQG